MIILSRPAFDYGVVFGSSAQLPPEAKNMYFFPRGRDALLVALRALRIMPGETVIIPAYICDSTIGPLRQAGYRIVFIDIKRDFQLDPVKVLDTAEKYAAKAVLAVHYFGFPSDVSRLTELLRPRGVRVVEDCCHSFLTHSGGGRIGSKGDAAIFSMRKTLPIPDGGVLRLNVQDFDGAAFDMQPEPAPTVGSFLAHRTAEAVAAAVGWPNIYSQALDKLKKRMRGRDKTHCHAAGAYMELRRQEPSWLLKSYLSNEDYLRQVSSRTAANYARITEGVLTLGLQPYMPELPTGCVPQWVPFYDLTGKIVPLLREHGVGASRWPWHELPVEVAELPLQYPVSNDFNFNLALMPVHQSIGPRQIKQMLRLLGQLVDLRPVSNNNPKTV